MIICLCGILNLIFSSKTRTNPVLIQLPLHGIVTPYFTEIVVLFQALKEFLQGNYLNYTIIYL
jgi:hypothetical protein